VTPQKTGTIEQVVDPVPDALGTVRWSAAPTSSRAAATGAALLATLGVAAAGWVVSIREMNGMDMGVATGVGSLAFFLPLWVWMMAAMMLPGAAPAVVRRGQERGVLAVPLFVGAYLGVWTLVGVVAYAVYGSHGTATAGAFVVAAGVYELTPVKQYFRRRCLERVGSGVDFGLSCVGSSIGFMVMFVALGVMSIRWMAVVAALVVAQKVLRPMAIIDVPLGLAILGFGITILVAPSLIPGLTPAM
jgi:predicted metal-binding membrane protein